MAINLGAVTILKIITSYKVPKQETKFHKILDPMERSSSVALNMPFSQSQCLEEKRHHGLPAFTSIKGPEGHSQVQEHYTHSTTGNFSIDKGKN
jgi:glutaminase